MEHPRFLDILATLVFLQPKHDNESDDYGKRYDEIMQLILTKVITDVFALINVPISELPRELDLTIAMMASQFIEALGLLDTDAEVKARATPRVKTLSEGDVSVTYNDKKTASAITSEALAKNTVTGEYKATLLHYRRLPT